MFSKGDVSFAEQRVLFEAATGYSESFPLLRLPFRRLLCRVGVL
jgi:hypothetical protein